MRKDAANPALSPHSSPSGRVLKNRERRDAAHNPPAARSALRVARRTLRNPPPPNFPPNPLKTSRKYFPQVCR